MKKILIALIIIISILSLFNPDSSVCEHEYVEHYGITNALKNKGLVSYYTCKKCSDLFDSNKNKVGTNDVVDLKNYISFSSSLFIIGRSVDISYSELSYPNAVNAINSLRADIKKGTKAYKEIEESYNAVMDMYYEMYNNYTYANLISDMYTTESYYNLTTYILEDLMLFYEQLYQIDLDFYNSSYKNLYFKNMTTEELNEYIASIDVDFTTAINALDIEIEKIKNAYSIDKNPDFISYFNQLKEKGNELANLYGYDNYLEYCYAEIYHRDYESDSIYILRSYIKNYLADLYNKYSNQFSCYTDERWCYNEFIDICNATISDEFENLAGYANMIGGQYMESFNHLWESGNFFFSNKNDNVTAYQTQVYNPDDGILFFGSSYQDINSFIHEFGHYNSCVSNTINCYDLYEVQSQGNELLYSQYLKSSNAKNTKVLDINLTYNTYSVLSTAINSYLTGYVEKVAYESSKSLTEADLQKIWDNECKYLGIDLIENTYWKYGLINTPGYYISYSTSAIASLEIFSIANTNLALGVETYKKLYSYPETCKTFVDVLEFAGLYSIFNENCYKFICSKL